MKPNATQEGDQGSFRAAQVCIEYTPESGGTTTAVRLFARALGESIVSFTSSEGLRNTQKDTAGVVHVPVHPGVWGHRYGWSGSRQKEIADRLVCCSDLVISHTLYRYHVQWAANIARNIGMPHWIIPHGTLSPYTFSYRAWQKKLWLALVGRRLLREADCVLFATEYEKKQALAYVNGIDSRVIHWPVEFVDIADRQDRRAAVRAQHQIPLDARVVLYLGRLHPIKRIIETVDAFGRCVYPHLHLIVAGPDSPMLDREQCARYCAEHNIDRVTFTGPLSDRKKWGYFAAADAFITISHAENFCFTAAEALACGLPVILSSTVGLASETRSLECGWTLDSVDSTSIATALREVATAPLDRLLEMGRRGQIWSRSELSFDRFSRQVAELALESVEAKRRRH